MLAISLSALREYNNKFIYFEKCLELIPFYLILLKWWIFSNKLNSSSNTQRTNKWDIFCSVSTQSASLSAYLIALSFSPAATNCSVSIWVQHPLSGRHHCLSISTRRLADTSHPSCFDLPCWYTFLYISATSFLNTLYVLLGLWFSFSSFWKGVSYPRSYCYNIILAVFFQSFVADHLGAGSKDTNIKWAISSLSSHDHNCSAGWQVISGPSLLSAWCTLVYFCLFLIKLLHSDSFILNWNRKCMWLGEKYKHEKNKVHYPSLLTTQFEQSQWKLSQVNPLNTFRCSWKLRRKLVSGPRVNNISKLDSSYLCTLLWTS